MKQRNGHERNLISSELMGERSLHERCTKALAGSIFGHKEHILGEKDQRNSGQVRFYYPFK